MLRVALSHIENRAVAEEVVQDAWLTVLQSLDRFQQRSAFRTWVLGIVVNLARSRARAEQRLVPLPSEINGPVVEQTRFLQSDHPRWPHHWAIEPAPWRTPEEDLLARETRNVILHATIAKHVDITERERRLAPPVIDALRAAGFFRLSTPRARGGLEIDPVTFARVIEEVSTFDSAAGWAFQINTGAWWTSRMAPDGAAELYADGPDLMMAASFAPPHRAEEVPGGYRITGRGPLHHP